MNIEAIKRAVGTGNWPAVEDLWMEGVEDNPASEAVGAVLEAMVEADHAETAETLAAMLLEAHAAADADARLGWAAAALLALPESDDLRKQTADLYREVHGGRESFDAIWSAAGLDGNQSPKRALRTLEVSLAVRPGQFMGNKFDGRVIRIERINPLGEFEFVDDGRTERLDPKLLADEFEPLDDDDFRVIVRQDPEAVAETIKKAPDRVLVGLCRARGGETDADRVKDDLVPKYIEASKWTGWWSRARTAGKKNKHLVFEGRSPVMIRYVAGGLSLEDELADDLDKAYEPRDLLGLLRTYLRECATRKKDAEVGFTGRITETLADRVRTWATKRPGEAFEGALALAWAVENGAPAPTDMPRSAEEILASADVPADCVAAVGDAELWAPALEAVRHLDNAADVLTALLVTAPADHLPGVAGHLAELNCHEAIAEAVKRALNEPAQHIDLCVWAWTLPGDLVRDLPPRVTILSKMLDALVVIDHDATITREARREARGAVRSALSAEGYAAFKATLAEIDEGMADVIKGKIERTDGLAQTVSGKMLHHIREAYWKLFIVEKPKPWLDKNVVWTSQAGLDAQQEELRVLMEELMPANAKQIGEAAELGDLRENADWQAAIEERDMLVSRQRAMNADLLRSRVITLRDVPDDEISVGSKVTLRRESDGQEVTISFLGPWDSDPEAGVYAYTTRLGEKLMGKKVGQSLELQISGHEGQYTVVGFVPAVSE